MLIKTDLLRGLRITGNGNYMSKFFFKFKLIYNIIIYLNKTYNNVSKLILHAKIKYMTIIA